MDLWLCAKEGGAAYTITHAIQDRLYHKNY